MKFQNHYNSEEFPRAYEHNVWPSLTVPDQSMSVKEIMDRCAQGLPISGAKVPVYNEEEIPDMKKLDLSERFEAVEKNRERIVLMQKHLQEKQEKEKKKQLDQSVIEFEDIPNNKNDKNDNNRTAKSTTKSNTSKDSKNQPGSETDSN